MCFWMASIEFNDHIIYWFLIILCFYVLIASLERIDICKTKHYCKAFQNYKEELNMKKTIINNDKDDDDMRPEVAYIEWSHTNVCNQMISKSTYTTVKLVASQTDAVRESTRWKERERERTVDCLFAYTRWKAIESCCSCCWVHRVSIPLQAT